MKLSEKEEKELVNRVLKIRTEEEIDKILEESVKEMEDPNTEWLTHEELKEMMRRRINENKGIHNKVS